VKLVASSQLSQTSMVAIKNMLGGRLSLFRLATQLVVITAVTAAAARKNEFMSACIHLHL